MKVAEKETRKGFNGGFVPSYLYIGVNFMGNVDGKEVDASGYGGHG